MPPFYKLPKEVDSVLRGKTCKGWMSTRAGHDDNWSDDLSDMPSGARFAATRGEPLNLDRLSQAPKLEAIQTWSTTQALVSRLPEVAGLSWPCYCVTSGRPTSRR